MKKILLVALVILSFIQFSHIIAIRWRTDGEQIPFFASELSAPAAILNALAILILLAFYLKPEEVDFPFK